MPVSGRLFSQHMIVVDGNNVIGAVPDGWWRDRQGAARRLLARLQCLQARTGDRLILVLDVVDPDLPEAEYSGVAVRFATRRGPNAADDRIRELVADLDDDRLDVVTSDRALAAEIAVAAHVVGAKQFLTRLDQAGC